ncbi:MAG: Bifunctional protein Aas [Chlamydiae bacterium]|nr:Bifunctional protein Aas [Chlamydiota bacterium]
MTVEVSISSDTQTKKRPMMGLLVSQFFGAFNDNAWKLIVFTLATRVFMPGSAGFEAASQYQATLGFLLFLFPMLVFSLPAGALADRISKRTVILSTKALEIFLMGAAMISLLIAPSALVVPYAILGLMGLQSALFSPAKYGIMPEILSQENLSRGNGLLEMWTMLAIIAGTGLGPIFLVADKAGALPSMTWIGPLCLFILSSAGFIAALSVPRVRPAQDSDHSVGNSVRRALKAIRGDKVLYMAIVGSAFYWFIISLLGQNVLIYAKSLVQNLQRGELLQGIPPASYGLGIALGALLAGRISGDRIEYGLIPLGAIGFAITSLLLSFMQPHMNGTVLILILMGIASGCVVVPLHALIQWRSPKDRRGGIIAFGNIMDISAMIVGSLFASSMAWAGLDLRRMLIVSAFMVVLATIWVVRLLPAAMIRLIFILLTLTFYRIRIHGAENIPKKGPALLTSNHMSIIDALFVMATVDRPVRFVMKDHYYNKWWIKPIARIMGAIPVSSTGGTAQVLQGMREASRHLEEGSLVCIFPEGQISKTGMMLPFKRGIETMMEGRKCPIIPIHLDLVWGSVFSFDGARFVTKHPHQIPFPLTVCFGKPLPPDSPVPAIREAIQELGCEAWQEERKKNDDLTHRLFIRQVRWKPLKTVMVDEIAGKMSRLKTLVGSIAIARKLRKKWGQQKNVAILLPSCVAAVLGNLAASISCRTAVNLNFSAGILGLTSAIEQAEIRTILTSRKFLAKTGICLPEGVDIVYLEDLKKKISSWNKLTAAFVGLFFPFRAVEKYCGAKEKLGLDDTLSILFTSGSTGKPKGVVLSHFNIASNIEAVSQIIPPLSHHDKLLAILPFFHSFGYMQMWLGLNHGFDLILHPNPLDAPAIGKLAHQHKATIMMTSPTFLKIYYQKIPPEQFSSLQCALTGAEKLPKKLAEDFEDRFGLYPIEGYGTTECSPVISATVPDTRKAKMYQTGSVRGTVGQPLPGVMVKTVNPETFEKLPTGEEGLLLVKGPNVMQGYLNQEELTAEVMKDGWYVTGDIATIDENGFIRITDRLSRFSKIGGEMVPHGTIEEALHRAADTEDLVFVVTAVPDSKKGETLVVLHTFDEGKIAEVVKKLSSYGLPNLYIPKLDHFFKVDTLPTLGSGKLDLSKIKTMAMQLS